MLARTLLGFLGLLGLITLRFLALLTLRFLTLLFLALLVIGTSHNTGCGFIRLLGELRNLLKPRRGVRLARGGHV